MEQLKNQFVGNFDEVMSWLQCNQVKLQAKDDKRHKKMAADTEKNRVKKSPVKGRGNLMFSQRNNPYCDLLQLVLQIYVVFCYKTTFFEK